MLPQRKTTRLDRECYGIKGSVFHMIVRSEAARPLFSDTALATDVYNGILTGPVAAESDVCAVCLMPDHLHILQGVIETNLIDLMQRWKTFTTNRLHRLGISGDIWQRSFYDHAMRDDEDLEQTANYIVENPVRAGIVAVVSDYPYAWHKWM
jgi:putative transposase